MFVYYDESILSYVASIRRYFGLSSDYEPNKKFSNLITSKNPKKIFLLLVDGMGANLINNKLSEDSFLRKNMLFKTTTVFPPTTTAATTSIRNGKAPSSNAWLGWTQYVKEVDDIIIPFRDTGFYNDKKYKKNLMYNIAPVAFTEDELNKIGISATTLFPSFVEKGAEDFDTMCNRLIEYSNSDKYEYVYAYWDKYDTYMHEYGPSSNICNAYLAHINYEIERVANSLKDDTMLVVIADHGQIDVKEEYNLFESKYDKYFEKRPALEPRTMAFYIKDGMKEEFRTEFINEFEDRFVLLTHQEVIETKLFGDQINHPRFEEFIGDFIAIGKASTTLAYKEEAIPMMKGQHAGICEDELIIPVIVYQK